MAFIIKSGLPTCPHISAYPNLHTIAILTTQTNETHAEIVWYRQHRIIPIWKYPRERVQWERRKRKLQRNGERYCVLYRNQNRHWRMMIPLPLLHPSKYQWEEQSTLNIICHRRRRYHLYITLFLTTTITMALQQRCSMMNKNDGGFRCKNSQPRHCRNLSQWITMTIMTIRMTTTTTKTTTPMVSEAVAATTQTKKASIVVFQFD